MSKMKKSGATLVETVLYLGLITIVFVALIQFALSVMEANQNSKTRMEIQRTSIFVFNHFDKYISNSDSIDTTNSVFDSDNGLLIFSKGATNYRYRLEENRLVFEVNSVDYNLTNRYISVDQLNFERVNDQNGNISGIRVTFLLKSSVKSFIQQTYSTYFTIN